MMRPDDSPGGNALLFSQQNQHYRQLLLSDRDRDRLSIQREHDRAVQLLDVVGTALDGADRTLDQLEADPDLLPTAILRRCTELADLIGSLASQLQQQSPNDRERLADAIQSDVRRQYESQHKQQMQQQQQYLRQLASKPERNDLHLVSTDSEDSERRRLVAAQEDDDGLNRNDILDALMGAVTLLRDVESSLRDIGKDDAEEIADVALTFARLFIMSLQDIHSTVTPDDVKQVSDDMKRRDVAVMQQSSSTRIGNTVFIEELTDNDGELDENGKAVSVSDVFEIASVIGTGMDVIGDHLDGTKISDVMEVSDVIDIAGDIGTVMNNQTNVPGGRPFFGRRSQRRIRIMWPRLGPHVETAMAWTKEEATKNPVLAVALGLTLWPVAITTALIGGSALLVDGIVQDAYNEFQDARLIDSLEQGAAQLYQAGRLGMVTGKLVMKQSLRVASRQIERQGGVQPILENVGNAALDRVAHPIETLGMIWGGLHWGIGIVKENMDKIISHRPDEQRAQELQ
jgi:hypothetical protein